ncbi:MAG: PKD domain-containing protein, partial [Bacteroidetes bacterium]
MTRTSLYSCCCLLLCFSFQRAILAQTASLTEGCPPLLVDFSPPGNQASYFWSFGNNVTSTERNPSTTFTQPGSYNVELRATENGPLLGSLTINVYPRPRLEVITDTTAGCVPFLINFSAQVDMVPNIDIQGYTWTYGDGSTGNSLNTTHIYSTPGIYSVSLELSAAQRGCSVTEVFPDLIRAGGIETVNFLTSPN